MFWGLCTLADEFDISRPFVAVIVAGERPVFEGSVIGGRITRSTYIPAGFDGPIGVIGSPNGFHPECDFDRLTEPHHDSEVEWFSFGESCQKEIPYVGACSDFEFFCLRHTAPSLSLPIRTEGDTNCSL